MPELSFDQITTHLDKKVFVPLYYLYGEETYFIDKLVQRLSSEVLTETEAAFNKQIYYGADVQAHQIINECRSFPVMSSHRLILLKEAQKLKKGEWDKLVGYVENPIPSSILVLAAKGKKGGLSKKGVDLVGKKGITFQAKRMYDRDVLKWVQSYLSGKGWQFDTEVPEILCQQSWYKSLLYRKRN